MFYRYLSKGDHVTITLWNHKKIHKNIQKPTSGFLGCVRLSWNQIQRYKDTGCKCTNNYNNLWFFFFFAGI